MENLPGGQLPPVLWCWPVGLLSQKKKKIIEPPISSGRVFLTRHIGNSLSTWFDWLYLWSYLICNNLLVIIILPQLLKCSYPHHKETTSTLKTCTLLIYFTSQPQVIFALIHSRDEKKNITQMTWWRHIWAWLTKDVTLVTILFTTWCYFYIITTKSTSTIDTTLPVNASVDCLSTISPLAICSHNKLIRHSTPPIIS